MTVTVVAGSPVQLKWICSAVEAAVVGSISRDVIAVIMKRERRIEVVRPTALCLLKLGTKFKEFGLKIPQRVMKCKKTTFEELLRILLSK